VIIGNAGGGVTLTGLIAAFVWKKSLACRVDDDDDGNGESDLDATRPMSVPILQMDG
jgi:hypothetical protein